MTSRKIRFALVLALSARSASAQDRMPPIPPEQMTSAQKAIVAKLTDGPRSGVPAPFVPLLRVPEVLDRVQSLGLALRMENSLGPKLTEIVILLTARFWTQQYIYLQHYRLAERAGVSADVLTALSDGRRPTMSADEETVYNFVTELITNKVISDATYQRATARFGDRGVAEMVTLNGYYMMTSMIANATQVRLPDGTPPLLTNIAR